MKLIAHILALYFMFGSLLPGSDFSQLGKASAIWGHYQLHQQLAANSGKEASLFDFLYAHFLYPESHHHNDGGESHQELPLKSVHVFSQVLPDNSVPLTSALLSISINRAIPYYNFIASATHEGAVFRPPILS